jgi:iturin family lipopeptide synthetase A
MASQTTLDIKAMQVNRNISGRNYWKERLSDLEFRTYFTPLNPGSPTDAGSAYQDYTATASEALCSKINTIGKSDRAKQMVLLSALGVFLYKYASCSDVCIFTNFQPEGTDQQDPNNIVPVRMKGFEGVSLRQYLTAFKKQLYEDMIHSNYPVEKVVSAKGLKLNEIPATGLILNGISGSDIFDRLKLDVLFSFTIDHSLTLSIRYNSNKYDAEYIMLQPERYFELLDELISNPDQHISGIAGLPLAPNDNADPKALPHLSVSAKKDYAGASERYTPSPIRKAESREYYNLSIVQHRLYFLTEFDKQSLNFNLPAALMLKGIVNKEKLTSTFRKLIDRHESLRTSIRIINNEPVQLVSEEVNFEMEYFDATEDQVDGTIQKFIRPFDLTRAPLLRIGLIEVDPQTHYLIADMHHIISDGTSQGIFIKEFMALYDDNTLLPLELDYKDYALWQQNKAYRDKIESQKHFWIRNFSEPFVPLDIPLDFVKPSITEEDEVGLDFSREETRKLGEIAENEIATTSMLLLAILNVLLNKVSGQDDVIVGLTVSGREQIELETIVGMFPLVLPLRSHPGAGLTFREFLAALKSTFLETLDNQSYPYEDLAKELNLERSTSRNPWFDVIVFFQNFDTPAISLPGLQLSPYKSQNIPAGEKLMVVVREVEGQIMMRLVYSAAFFKKRTIENLAVFFRKITESVMANVAVKLRDIDILGDDEKRHLLNSFCGGSDIDRTKSFSALFREQVQKTPHRIAVEHNGTMLSYESLYRSSVKIAAHFMHEGLSSGSIVALLLPRGIGMLESILALFHCGCAYIPIDEDFTRQRVEEILSESGSNIVLTTREMLPLINELKIFIPTLRAIVPGDQWDEKEPAINYEASTSTDDLAYIIYTSGTSGKPKGVMVHQLGMINHLNAFIDIMKVNEGDIIAQTASACFDISVWQFLAALVTGARTYIIDKEKIHDPELLIRAMQEGNVTIFQSVPSLLSGFLNNLPGSVDTSLPGLRWMVTTGESLTVPLARSWYSLYPAIPILNVYGPTEASDDVTTYVVEHPGDGQLSIPIGKAIPNIRVYILDDSLNLCPAGVKGEICIAGIGVGKGYWRDEDKTRKAFIPNPLADSEVEPDYATLYKTGDIGYYLEDGNIICLGRKDDQVKIRGFRVELEEITGWLLKYKPIREVVVLVNHEKGDKYLVAYYVSDEEIQVGELEAYLSDHLPYYMIPSYFIHLQQMPLTINAKLDKRLLAQIEMKVKINYSAPSHPTEEKLIAIWAKILKTDPGKISTTTNFFTLGGHSLTTISLINEVDREFGVKISLKDFFHRPTIAGMAKHISNFSL